MASTDDRMGATVRQMLDFLSANRMLSPDELSLLRAAWTGSKLDADAGEFARLLVEAGKLTKYQAAAAYMNQARSVAVGEYLLLDRIGGGGVGTVYKARRHDGDSPVALKVLNSASARWKDAVKRFRREAEAAIRLDHPDIARAFEAGEADGRLYLVMELLDGVDLSTYLRKKGPPSVEQAVEWILSAARGLAYAHAQGIIHRDIKPGNLFLTKRKQVKVLDLGLARMLDAPNDNDDLTRTGQVMGTVDYMAPEQALNTRQADARADIYSLGCTFYRLVTGENPFGGETLVEKVLAHREQPVPSLRDKNKAVPPSTDAVFRRMLAKNPADRFQTMDDVADALGRSLSEPSVQLAQPPAPVAAHDASPAASSAANSLANSPAAGAAPPRAMPIAWALPANPADARSLRRLPFAVYVAAALALLAIATTAVRLILGPPPEPLPADGVAQQAGSASAPSATGTATATGSPPSPASGITAPTPSSSAAAPSPTPTGTPPAGTPTVTAQPSAPMPAAPPAIGRKHPVPNADALTDAILALRNEFRADYSKATAASEIVLLAGTLLKRADTPALDPLRRFALLTEARDWSLQAADMEKADEAARRAEADYELDRLDWLADGVTAAADLLKPGPIAKQLTGEAWLKIDEAVAAQKMAQAEHLVRAAAAAAAKSLDASLERLVTERVSMVVKGRVTQEAAFRMRDRLADHPDDPTANTVWGRYLCFVRNDWEQGLTHLANGDDLELRNAARDGFPVPDDVAGLVAVGDLWSSRAESATDASSKADYRRGAVYWYRLAFDRAVEPSRPTTRTSFVDGRRQVEFIAGHNLSRPKLKSKVDEAQQLVDLITEYSPSLPTYLQIPISKDSPIDLRLIPPGTFLMGSPAGEAERRPEETQHPVLLTRPFYLGVTEVTEAQWRSLVGTVLQFDAGEPRLPANLLSRESRETFFEKLNKSPFGTYLRFRLPTEAEWEYAARAGTTTPYYWGAYKRYSFANDSNKGPKRVGGRRPNAWGLYDVSGNVFEICADAYDPAFYGRGLVIDPFATPSSTASPLVVRGGGSDSSTDRLRSAYRQAQPSGLGPPQCGVRIACDVIGTISPEVVAKVLPNFSLAGEIFSADID
jgi:serine/threonine protein kinase